MGCKHTSWQEIPIITSNPPMTKYRCRDCGKTEEIVGNYSEPKVSIIGRQIHIPFVEKLKRMKKIEEVTI